MHEISRNEYLRLRKLIKDSKKTGYTKAFPDPCYDVLLMKGFMRLKYSKTVSEHGEQITEGQEPTDSGRAYIEWRRMEFIKFLIPFAVSAVIAIAALIISIISISIQSC